MPPSTAAPFAEALEAADRLSLSDQENLLEILHHRIVEMRREELVRDVGEAQAEFKAGGCEPRSAAELMDEILGWDAFHAIRQMIQHEGTLMNHRFAQASERTS